MDDVKGTEIDNLLMEVATEVEDQVSFSLNEEVNIWNELYNKLNPVVDEYVGNPWEDADKLEERIRITLEQGTEELLAELGYRASVYFWTDLLDEMLKDLIDWVLEEEVLSNV